MWIFPLFSCVTLLCKIPCLITDELIIPQPWLTVATGHYFHLIAVASQDNNEKLCFKFDGKEKFSLKSKFGRAAFLAKLQNLKISLSVQPPPPTILVCSWNCTNYWTHESIFVHPLTCWSGIKLLHFVINYEFPKTESTFESVLTIQHHSTQVQRQLARNCSWASFAIARVPVLDCPTFGSQ